MARLNTNWGDTRLFKLSGLLHITLPAVWTMDRGNAETWVFSQAGLKDRDDWGALYISFRTLPIENDEERLAAQANLLTGGMQQVTGDKTENTPDAPDFDPDNPFVAYITRRAAPIVQGLGLVEFRLEIKHDRTDRPEFIALMEQLHPEFYRAELQITDLLPSYGHALDGAAYRAPVNCESPVDPGALPPGMADMAAREVEGLARVTMPVVWEEERETDRHRCFIESIAQEPNPWGAFYVTAGNLGIQLPPGEDGAALLPELFMGMGAQPNRSGDLWLIEVEDAVPNDRYDTDIHWEASIRYWRWARLDAYEGGAQVTTFSLTIEQALKDRPEFQALVGAMEAAAFSAEVYPGRLL